MLKELVNYTDYNDVDQAETIYFNLTKTEMMDLLDLQPRLEAWSKITSAAERELTTEEVRELLSIIKFLIEKSYGVRSEDGKHFRKSPSIFADFEQSAAYDTFIFSLFENPERAVQFMTGILPKDIADEVQGQSASITSITEVALPDNEIDATEAEVPAYLREDREPTKEELRNMNSEELRAAFQRRTSN